MLITHRSVREIASFPSIIYILYCLVFNEENFHIRDDTDNSKITLVKTTCSKFGKTLPDSLRFPHISVSHSLRHFQKHSRLSFDTTRLLQNSDYSFPQKTWSFFFFHSSSTLSFFVSHLLFQASISNTTSRAFKFCPSRKSNTDFS